MAVKYDTRYFRDGVELAYESWSKMFDADLSEDRTVAQNRRLSSDVMTDRSNGRQCNLNGHIYTQQNVVECDCAVEIIKTMLLHGSFDEILDAAEKLPEDIARALVEQMESVERRKDHYMFPEPKI